MAKVIKLKKNFGEEENGYSRFLNNFPEVNLGSLTICLFCVLLMLMASFTQLPVGLYDSQMITGTQQYFSSLNNLMLTLHSHLYSPQVPIAIFAGALLGPRLGMIAMILYVGLGLLGFPFFADGGGLAYIYKPSFGFLLGFIASSYAVGKIFNNKINSINIIFAATFGVITLHFIGVFYLLGTLFFSFTDFEIIKTWVYTLSLSNLPYDILFSIILCALARPIRGILWLAIG